MGWESKLNKSHDVSQVCALEMLKASRFTQSATSLNEGLIKNMCRGEQYNVKQILLSL